MGQEGGQAVSEIEYGFNFSGMSLICPRCGASVSNQEVHEAFHGEVDEALSRLADRERYEAEALERED